MRGSPRIWIHAVSVGEVNVAGAVIQALKQIMPHCAVILSTTTAHGQAVAVEKLGGQAVCVYAPLDFILSVQHAFSVLKPDIFVCLETEIWPNWLMTAHRMGIKTALVNGRLSVRSIHRYLKIRPLMKEILAKMDVFSMIHAEDAKRIHLLGAPAQNISVGGNAKYELLRTTTEAATAEAMKKRYRIQPDQPVLVAGSTRGAEGGIVLRMFKRLLTRFPQALLIIAPRHLNRVPEISEWARSLELSCQFRTQIDEDHAPRTASVVIVDTIGELQAIYGIASVVFCGASLVPLGGQNILEAAVWGKPVLYGPSMDDFRDARELLESVGGGIEVADEAELAEKVAYYFSRPDEASGIGLRARQAVLSQSGAAGRHAAVIHHLLSEI